MFAKNYYYLVAGLSEYTINTERKGFDAIAIRDLVMEDLEPKDRDRVRLLYGFYDIENIISILSGKNSFNTLGNASKSDLERVLTESPQELPEWLSNVILSYRNSNPDSESESEVDTSMAIDRSLWAAYYARCAKSNCRFIKQWSEFDSSLRNICAAYVSRANNLDPASALVGKGEIVDALSRSSAADFGLKNEVDYVDKVISIMEMDNIVAKEQEMDLLRWEQLNDLVTFDYFNINFILAYLAKVNIVHRWSALDRTQGKQMLDNLLQELSSPDALKQSEQSI